MKKVRWGVLGVARIAVNRVIPAMQAGECSEIVAIASRDRVRAEGAARELGIPKAYGSYEEMLADPGDRSRLQSPAQSPARAVVHARRRGRQARAVRKADRP